jgi:hypothetical protein
MIVGTRAAAAALVACVTVLSVCPSARAGWSPYHGDLIPNDPGLGNFMNIAPSKGCSNTPHLLLRVSVTISWGGTVEKGSDRFGDACAPTIGGDHSKSGKDWSMSASSLGVDGQWVYLGLDDLNNVMRRADGYIRFDLTAGSHHQTLRFQFTQQPGGRIWQGTDAFVNYCIDGTHVVHSSGGNLYCDRPSATWYRVAG